MAYKYIIHELAQQEYETSLQWYAERSKRAAENFITAVNDALQLISASPTRWRNSYVTHRATHYSSGNFFQFCGSILSMVFVVNRCMFSNTSLNQ